MRLQPRLKAELPKAQRDRFDKARERREKDMKKKLSKAPCKNHAEGHCKFSNCCQFSDTAPGRPDCCDWMLHRLSR